MKTNAGDAIRIVFRKLGVKNPEQYETLLEELTKVEFEEEIEGDIRQRVEGLATVEEFKRNPKARAEMKAEFLNGLEKDGLADYVKTLDDIDQAEYQRKDGATNKIKHIIDAVVKTKTKLTQPNRAEEEILRTKVLEMEAKIASGEYVPKSQLQALADKITTLNEGSFRDKILSKLSPKVVEHMNDPELLNLKVSNYMKNKGLIYNHEEDRFYENRPEGLVPATKDKKTVDLMNIDDLVSGVLSADERLVKKSDTPSVGVLNVPTATPPIESGYDKALLDKAEAHRMSLGK